MRFEENLIIVVNVYPFPVVIDRLPLEGPDGMPMLPRRRFGLPTHVSPVAEICPLMLESSGGGPVSDKAIVKLMEKRLDNPFAPLTRMIRIIVPPDESDGTIGSEM